MTTDIDICNMALSHIGARSAISDFQEASVEAQQCRLLYAPARDAVLREHPWNFATRRQALAEMNRDAVGWGYGYALPTDCLVARSLVTDRPDLPPIPFEVLGDALYTDQEQAVLTYTSRVIEVRLFDPMFVVALSWRLALDLVPSITGSKTIQQTIQRIYRNEIAAAQAADSAEGAADRVHAVDWIRARG